jgi:hypothetical protein
MNDTTTRIISGRDQDGSLLIDIHAISFLDIPDDCIKRLTALLNHFRNVQTDPEAN